MENSIKKEIHSNEELVKKVVRSEWTQILVTIAAISAMFLWNRSESNADRRELTSVVKAIQEEIKDFHGRLCVLEERTRK